MSIFRSETHPHGIQAFPQCRRTSLFRHGEEHRCICHSRTYRGNDLGVEGNHSSMPVVQRHRSSKVLLVPAPPKASGPVLSRELAITFDRSGANLLFLPRCSASPRK